MIRKVKKNIFFWLVNNMPAARKGEKITDPVVLERLAKAREKAICIKPGWKLNTTKNGADWFTCGWPIGLASSYGRVSPPK